MSLVQLGIGLLLGGVAGGLAHAAGALTPSGAAAAGLVGGLTYGFGGLGPSILLLAFFVSSSLLSRVGSRAKEQLAGRTMKGDRRNRGQVLANGLFPAILAIGYGLAGQLSWLVGISGALAAANADTWATELGVLAARRPRLITNWRPVARGTSGAVSLTGSLAALGGSLLISLLGAGVAEFGLRLPGRVSLDLAASAAIGGLVGAFGDSLLGATVQASYRCPNCNQETERHPLHTCGAMTVPVGGWRWLGNDQVNLLASAAGGIVSVAVWSGICSSL